MQLPGAIDPVRRRWVAGALLVGTFLASLEVMVVAPAMPVVVDELGSAGLYPWIFTTYIKPMCSTCRKSNKFIFPKNWCKNSNVI